MLAATLRARIAPIAARFERACADLDELRGLERSALLDHLPEVIAALADWMDAHAGDDAKRTPFTLLADGHALQRLGFHISLETVTAEYTLLRQAVLLELLDVPAGPDVRQDLITLHLALDHAVREAIRRYSQERDVLRERFLGILGHDLRGPLSAITAGVDALLGGDADPRVTRIAARMSRATSRMDRMIGDMLDFARGHLGGGIPCNPTRHDLGNLCRQAVEELAAAHPERTIQCDISGELLGTFDGDRISQVLGNLLNNAIAHGADPITLRAESSSDRGEVTVRISNAGPAIPAELLPRLFDPFRAGRSARSAGLGLGLYIVQQIARTHGGRCEVTSTDAETAFTLHLPRVPVELTPNRP